MLRNSCQTSSMRKLATTLCLAVSVLVALDIHSTQARSAKAENAIQCAALYLISSSFMGRNKQAAKSIGSIQQIFQGVFSAIERKRLGKIITNGMISKEKSSAAEALGRQYDRNSSSIYRLEMRCNAWRRIITHRLSGLGKGSTKREIRNTMRTIPNMPLPPSQSDPRWSRSRDFVDRSFKAWTNLGRITPQSVKQRMKR